MHNAGLSVANCFDAVLRDSERSVYLRRAPDLANHQVVLSNTSVVVQDVKWREQAQAESEDDDY